MSLYENDRTYDDYENDMTYDELREKIKDLGCELATVIEALKIATQSADDQMLQKREAQAQRDKARNDALEEAAKICEEYANVGVVGARICAAAICAKKEFGAHMTEMHEFIAENQRLIELSESKVLKI